jgi:hypothetical protein
MTSIRIPEMNRSIFENRFQIQPNDFVYIIEQHMANSGVLRSGVYVPNTQHVTKFLLAPVEGVDFTDRVAFHTHSGKSMAEEHVYSTEYRRIVVAGKIFGAEEYTTLLEGALKGIDFKDCQARAMEDYVKHEQELADERKRILGELYVDKRDNLSPDLVRELKRIYDE